MKPGSEEAVKDGCKCPVMDNNHGKGANWCTPEGLDPLYNEPVFWMTEDCPIHGSLWNLPIGGKRNG